MGIAFTPAAWRDWKKLRLYARDPLRHAVKLSGPPIGQYRFRVGDYRIVFDLTESTIVVLAVGHRKDIYR